jgi:hypothetical protein
LAAFVAVEWLPVDPFVPWSCDPAVVDLNPLPVGARCFGPEVGVPGFAEVADAPVAELVSSVLPVVLSAVSPLVGAAVSPLVASAVSPAGAVVVTLVAAGVATLTVGAVDRVTVLDGAAGSAAGAATVEL